MVKGVTQTPMTNKTNSTKIEINGVRFMKHGVKDKAGKYYPAHVCRGAVVNGTEAITIYARCLLRGLPVELMPENDTDICTDYFEKDRARFLSGTPEFEALAAIAR